MTGATLDLHAGCLLLGEAGILIRGEAGSGKSSLARRLVARRLAAGGFAALVADDRVRLRRAHGRLIAEPHPAIAGLVEIRGLGIVPLRSEPAAILRLVVDLVPRDGARLPEDRDRVTSLLGIDLARIESRAETAAELVEAGRSWP